MTMFMGDTASTSPVAPAYPLDAYAGYVAGYVTYPTLLQRFGSTHHVVSITPNVDNVADVLDVETGDAVAPQAGPWVREMLNRGVWRPCIYAQASRMPLVEESLRAEGLARSEYRLWVADWDNNHTVPAGYDAKQFYGTVSGSWDYSVVNDDFFPAPSKPKPKTSYQYNRYNPGVERRAAMRYDFYRDSPSRAHKDRAKLLVQRNICRVYARRIILAIAVEKRRPKRFPGDRWDHKDRKWRYHRLSKRGHGERVDPDKI